MGVPAAILPKTGISVTSFFWFSESRPPFITLGEKGLYYFNGKEEIYMEANQVKAIDTTGAGDAFNGGFSFALLKGKKIKDCLEFANKVAGLSTTKLGAGDSMPNLKELND